MSNICLLDQQPKIKIVLNLSENLFGLSEFKIVMRKAFLSVCIALLFAVSLYFLQSQKTNESLDYRFEIIEGKRICVNNGIYLLRFAENSEATIKTIYGWNLTLNESLWVSNVLKCLNGTIYAASVGIAKIEDGKKDFVTKRVSYEGTRDLEGKFINVMVEGIHRGCRVQKNED